MKNWPSDQISMLTDSFPYQKQEPYKEQAMHMEMGTAENPPQKVKIKGTNKKGTCSDITDKEGLPSDYVVLDFETTGLRECNSRIIQAAAYKYRGYTKTDEMVTYVDPGEPIPENITELTGIGNEDVQGAPSIDEALPKLIEFIKDEIIIGHNIAFDLRFLVYNAEQYGIHLPYIEYIDTLKLSRRYIKGAETTSLKH